MKQILPREAKLPVRWTDQLFRTLAESTTTAIFVCREDRVLYVNPACEELTGYSAEELLGESSWDLVVPPELRPALRDRATARLRGEPVPERYETRILTKEGREKWIDLTAAVIVLDDGEPAALATAVDVTERKQAEVALRESSARLSSERSGCGPSSKARPRRPAPTFSAPSFITSRSPSAWSTRSFRK